jgi:AraC-like DNA-binding protein
MSKFILTYPLADAANQERENLDVFFLDKKILDKKRETPAELIDVPLRNNLYAVGICLRGEAELKVNMETYTVKPNCLVVRPPHLINQFTRISDDFETLSVFFTKEFVTAGNNSNPDKFQFFESLATRVFQTSETEMKIFIEIFQSLREKYDAPHPYRNEILKSLITILLYETASIYDRRNLASTSGQTTSRRLLASEFKKLLTVNFAAERNLRFYAEKLSITPKHLTETIKETTGKTASEWIAEAVVLEAKVLMQNPQLSIERISETLRFADQSTFGKFFKNRTGLSPSAYKQTL